MLMKSHSMINILQNSFKLVLIVLKSAANQDRILLHRAFSIPVSDNSFNRPYFILSNAFSIPYMIACGRGGQPGIYTSTGTIESIPLFVA